MSDLGPQYQNLSYQGLLQVPGGITSSLQQVQDGDGNLTGLLISSTGISATGFVATTTQNITGGAAGYIPYQSSSGTTSFIASGSSGFVLTANGSGAPSWSNTAPHALTSNATTSLAGGTAGAIPFQSSAGVTSYVAPGSAGQIFVSQGLGTPVWATFIASSVGALAIDGSNAMTANLNAGANRIVNVAAPSASTDAATKGYVDSVASGLNIKESCDVATTANITLSGVQSIDGVAVGSGQRVLVKNQTTSQDNGIYVSGLSAWTRATDADTWSELVGATVFIQYGTTNDATTWTCNIAAGGTLGTTPITFVQFGASQAYTAGYGLTLAGNEFSLTTPVTANYAIALQTARTINGVPFDGTTNITIPSTSTYSVTFDNSGSGAASGASFNGSTAQTISYNTIGAPSSSGSNVTAGSTWPINITGNASSINNATGVTAGSYSNANITVNAQGLITNASTGSSGGGFSVVGSSPDQSSVSSNALLVGSYFGAGNGPIPATNVNDPVQWCNIQFAPSWKDPVAGTMGLFFADDTTPPPYIGGGRGSTAGIYVFGSAGSINASGLARKPKQYGDDTFEYGGCVWVGDGNEEIGTYFKSGWFTGVITAPPTSTYAPTSISAWITNAGGVRGISNTSYHTGSFVANPPNFIGNGLTTPVANPTYNDARFMFGTYTAPTYAMMSAANVYNNSYVWAYGPSNVSGNEAFVVTQNSGSYLGVALTWGSNSWSSLSDENYKDIIEPITNASEKISNIRTVIGKFKTDEPQTRRSFLIAQDFQQHFPEAVEPSSFAGEPALGLKYTETLPLVIAAVKEILVRLDALESKINSMQQ